MKKASLLLVLACISLTSYSQTWSGSTPGNMYYNSGNIGISNINPSSILTIGTPSWSTLTNSGPLLLIIKSTVIGNSAGTYSYISEQQQSGTGNINRLQTALYRRVAGGTWQGMEYRLQYAVDNSFTDGSKAFVSLGGSDPNTSGGGFISFGTSGLDRMSINNSGQVGIGTTLPVSPLTLGSNITNMQSNTGITLGIGQTNVEFLNSAYGSGFGAKIYGVDSGSGNTSLRIATRGNSTTWTDALTVTASAGSLTNGYVGIGTNSPDQKLTVNGTIHSKEVKVDTSIPVPDYVFDKSYQLKNLTELQEYITKNKHLPEIPSATEIEKTGINLSEMNLKLLKKVEELTLYLIEKDKQEKEQQQINQAQQTKVDRLEKQVEQLTKSLQKN